MIDFHTHILPCMDDGSGSIQESVTLLRQEARQGIETVVLTPHFYPNRNSPEQFLEKRYHRWQQLKPYLWPELPQLILGAEVQYFEGISASPEMDSLRVEGTDLLLLEMPFSPWPERVVQEVLELEQRQELHVVLAHIERYLAMQPKAHWDRLREQGVWMQSNVSFFAEWKTRRRAMRMLADGQIQLLGSDCHNLQNRCPNWDKLPEKARVLAESSEASTALKRMLTAITS